MHKSCSFHTVVKRTSALRQLTATSVFIKQPRGMECDRDALLSIVIACGGKKKMQQDRGGVCGASLDEESMRATTPSTQTASGALRS